MRVQDITTRVKVCATPSQGFSWGEWVSGCVVTSVERDAIYISLSLLSLSLSLSISLSLSLYMYIYAALLIIIYDCNHMC